MSGHEACVLASRADVNNEPVSRPGWVSWEGKPIDSRGKSPGDIAGGPGFSTLQQQTRGRNGE